MPPSSLMEGDVLIYWSRPSISQNESAESKVSFCLLDIAESDRPGLMGQYLQMLRDIGGSRVGGTTVESLLMTREGLSSWWTGVPLWWVYEASCPASVVIRLLVLEQILLEACVEEVSCWVDDPAARDAIRILAGNWGLAYRKRRHRGFHSVLRGARKVRVGLGRVLLLLRQFAPLQGMRRRLPTMRGEAPDVLFLDYLAGLDLTALKRDQFQSSYWAGLPNLLREESISASWLHIFTQGSRVLGRRRDAGSALCRLNTDGMRHTSSLDWCSAGVWVGAAGDYMRLLRKVRLRGRLKRVVASIQPALWPVLRGPLFDSIWGLGGIESILWLRLFEQVASATPAGTPIVYLQENQAWESALLSAWTTLNGGQTVGVIHTVVRPWDVRLMWSHQGVTRPAYLPLPSRTLVNGPAALRSLTVDGLVSGSIRRVEALRFLAPRPSPLVLASGPDPDGAIGLSGVASDVRRFVVIGEYDDSHSTRLISIGLAAARCAEAAGSPWDVTWRSHPARGRPRLPSGWKHSSGGDLVSILQGDTRVLAGETSSSVFHVLASGKPLAIVLPPSSLSSLNGQQVGGIHVVGSGEEAYEWLASQVAQPASCLSAFFDQDAELGRWREFVRGLATAASQ